MPRHIVRGMYFADTLTLDAPRRTSDGYLAVRARAARTGVYQYAGREVDPNNQHGLRDQAIVNVLRDAEEVFDPKSLGSFVGKPITDNHPTVPVTTKNWRDHARGVNMGAVPMGDYVGFDLAFMDADTIAKIDSGKVELSNGYSCDLQFGDFAAADGTKCQARQTKIRGNHIALVDRGRAGSDCKVVADAAACDALPSNLLDSLTQESPVPKIVLIDGLSVDVSNADTAATTIATLIAARDAANGKVTTLEASVAAKDAEIVTLTADKAKLESAKPTPAQLRDAAKAFAAVCDKAKGLGVTVTDEMDEAAIRKAVVDAKLGASAATYTADQYAVAFDVLTKDAKPVSQIVQPIGSPTTPTNIASIRDAARVASNF